MSSSESRETRGGHEGAARQSPRRRATTGRGGLWESVFVALGAIRANKMRSILTSLGIVIGVMNVVAMVSLIGGFNESVMDLFRTMGTNTFIVTKFPAGNVSGVDFLKYWRRPDFTYEDAQAIERNCSAVAAVSPQTFAFKKATYEGESTRDIPILGVTPEYQYVSDSDVADGRFFAWPESDRRKQVAVLGHPIKEQLFHESDPIGRDIRVGGRRFRVVGVMEPLKPLFGQSIDDYVVVPFKTLNKLFGSRFTSRIAVKARSSEVIDEAMDQVIQVLRDRRRVKPGEANNFEVITQSQLVEMYENLTRMTQIVMIGISAIALIVGGVGIMNIMLVSVTERTREIGIRKAVGARPKDIMAQFLVEAVVLSGLGGLVGMAVALALAKFVATVTPFPAAIELWSVVLAIAVSASVGIFFGLYPASRAAKLDPIIALGHE
jgi:putative ABC transport system permease protein